MDIVICVAGLFIGLGLLYLLAPEQVAEWGIRWRSADPHQDREILKRYPRLTRWSARIVGCILVVAGLVIFIASRAWP